MSETSYTITGTITNSDTPDNPANLDISLYRKGKTSDELLGFFTTNQTGKFSISFESDDEDLATSLYFLVQSGGLDLATISPVTLGEPNELKVNNDTITKLVNKTQAAGWVGGFPSPTNDAFNYPKPNLISLPLYENMANIDLLQRQQKIIWPEFSWQAKPVTSSQPTEAEKKEAEASRCFQMFAPDISRVGYTNEGRVYSIICPQQGAALSTFGSLNVEVSVMGNRGWVNEDPRGIASDMRVTGKVWFAANNSIGLDLLKGVIEKILKSKGIDLGKYKLPITKANAIHVKTSLLDHPKEPTFPLYNGLSSLFDAPDFTRHDDLAWSHGHIDVQIGEIWKTGEPVIDFINQKIIDLFNQKKRNMLKNGNVLTWNVWFTAPEVVDQKEWGNHAEFWRHSIQVDHGSPNGNGTAIRNAQGQVIELLSNEADQPRSRSVSAAPKTNAAGASTDLVASAIAKEKEVVHSLIEKYLDGDEVKKIKEELEKV